MTSRWCTLSGGHSLDALQHPRGMLPGWYPQCHRPRAPRLLSMTSPFPLTVKWPVSALIFCLSSSSSIWFCLQCPSLPQFPLKKNPSLLVPFHKTSMTSRHSHYFDFQNKIIRWMSLIRKIILENLTSICYITPFLWLLDLICCISRLERELLSFPDGSVYEHLNNFYSS